MKRIILVSLFFIISFVVFFCTDDTLEKTSNAVKVTVVADDQGDPVNSTPPIKP